MMWRLIRELDVLELDVRDSGAGPRAEHARNNRQDDVRNMVGRMWCLSGLQGTIGFGVIVRPCGVDRGVVDLFIYRGWS
jgi:signal transduction histidine kinase